MSKTPGKFELRFHPSMKSSGFLLITPRWIWEKFWGIIFLLSILVSSFAFAGQPHEDQGAGFVLRVVDGDTLKIEHGGRIENLRLIGIDTPESRVNQKAKRDAARNREDIEKIINLGQEATRYAKSLVKPGDRIKIEFDRQFRDKYGRLLGYVYLPNGKMLNEEIVKAGYANLMTYPPNVKYEDRFLRAYREARENNRGLWSKY
jgi:micrococcal nuclease